MAAAALVAVAGGAAINAPDDVTAWLDGKRDLVKPLAAQAAKAIGRIASGKSELRELWLEADSEAEWLSHLNAVAAALNVSP